jgi:DNA invertase Pin-like site-specific DNA recombinase
MAKAKQSGKRVAVYLRVSTTEQTTANQRRELQRVAARHGWTVVGVRGCGDIGCQGARSAARPRRHDEGGCPA